MHRGGSISKHGHTPPPRACNPLPASSATCHPVGEPSRALPSASSAAAVGPAESLCQGPSRGSFGPGTVTPGAELAPWPHAKAKGGACAPMAACSPCHAPGPGRICAAPYPLHRRSCAQLLPPSVDGHARALLQARTQRSSHIGHPFVFRGRDGPKSQ